MVNAPGAFLKKSRYCTPKAGASDTRHASAAQCLPMSIDTPDLKTWIRAAKRDGLALWFALRHPQTPGWIKAGLVLVVAYALSPIDLIPDFIPVIGYLDEAILLPLAVGLLARALPAGVMAECRAQAEQWLADGRAKPKMVLGALLIAAIWLIALGAAWQAWSGG